MTYMRDIQNDEVHYDAKSKKLRADNFKRCCYIFGLQVILVALLAYYFLKNREFELGDFPTQVSRYICAILLHI